LRFPLVIIMDDIERLLKYVDAQYCSIVKVCVRHATV
jgi:hypothetical protein